MTKNISTGTIVRTLCLILALANQLLSAFGKSPLPIDNAQLEQLVTGLITVVGEHLLYPGSAGGGRAVQDAAGEERKERALIF